VGKVHYRIKHRKDGSIDPAAVYNYHYRYQKPHRLVKDLAYQVLCRIAANQNFLEWIHIDREKNARIFAKRLQASLDNRHSGIEILFAGIPSVHPPAKVSGKYEEVINAYQEMQTMIHDAEKSAVARKFAAMGRAAEVLNDAQVYTYRLTTVAKAERDRFEIQRQAYEKAPRVYRFRKYFTAVEDLLTGHRLYIVPIVEDEVNIIDMQEKLGSDILDINLEEGLQ
jgi:regulator of protease activity HflC (stomatin/prohibitin superfamily)